LLIKQQILNIETLSVYNTVQERSSHRSKTAQIIFSRPY